MTVYRYVRTGRLDAHRRGGTWRVRTEDVDAFSRQPPPGRGRGRPRWSQHAQRLRSALVRGDEPGAWHVVERVLVGGADPTDVYVRVLGPALEEVGELWEAGKLSVEAEHRATAVAGRIIGRLGPRFTRPGRRRGTIVVGAAPQDPHALPSAMLADVLRGAGYGVIDLGGSTPAESFVSAAASADDLVAIGISVSTSAGLAPAQTLVAAMHGRFDGVPVLLGGPAVTDEQAARAVGADAWAADAAAAVEVIAELRSWDNRGERP
jgi:methanogenic corrinoid protein MtbC1